MEIGQKYANNTYENLNEFIQIVLKDSIEGDYRKIINEIYSGLECLDTDLLLINGENDFDDELKKDIKALLDFYYDNIEKHINFFEEQSAKLFLIQLTSMCQTLRLKMQLIR